MKIEHINSTTWANIYGIYNNAGKPVGTVEVILGGANAGTYFYSLSGKYSKKDIRKFWKQYR